jgi:hypothetical protein
MTTLYCIFARDADSAVIFRRGPSQQVCLIGWDLRGHTFERGQWLKGRIYERKCDLSPNGRKLVYFAANFRRTSELATWTAVSSVPYLKAHVLWGGAGTWNDISLFETNGLLRLAVYGAESAVVPHGGFSVPRQLQVEPKPWPGHFYKRADHLRLIRDGWLVHEGDAIYRGAQESGEHQLIYHRPLLGKGHGARLEMAVTNSGASSFVFCDGVGDAVPLAADWADVRGKTIYFSDGGHLSRISFSENGKRIDFAAPKRLADFGDMKFEAIAAPGSALTW